jgi:hypothetical protein
VGQWWDGLVGVGVGEGVRPVPASPREPAGGSGHDRWESTGETVGGTVGGRPLKGALEGAWVWRPSRRGIAASSCGPRPNRSDCSFAGCQHGVPSYLQ